MKMELKALAVASLTIAAAACGAGEDATTGTSSGATGGASSGTSGADDPTEPAPFWQLRDFFISEVYPALLQDCGSCHAEGQHEGPIFLAGEPFAAYDFILEYNNGALVEHDENLLLLKGRHEGPNLTGPTRGAVQMWIALENPNVPPYDLPRTLYSSLKNFGQCLSKQAFLGDGLDQLFNLPTDAVPGAACTCATCHNQSDAADLGGSLILDPDANVTFAGLQHFPGMMIFAQGRVSDTGTNIGLLESHRIELKGKELNIHGPDQTACLCDPNHRLDPAVSFGQYCHPTYALNQALIDKIDTFVEKAIDRDKTLLCNAGNTP